MLTIVLHQYCEHLLVESLIPFLAIVSKLYILLRLFVLWSLNFHSVESHSTGSKLVGTTESLAIVCPNLHIFEALVIELLHLIEVELSLQIACRILISFDTLLVVALQIDDADRVDTLVHTKRVLPIVRALSILRIILDTYSLVGTHMANHHILLYTTHLSTRSILSIAHLVDTKA